MIEYFTNTERKSLSGLTVNGHKYFSREPFEKCQLNAVHCVIHASSSLPSGPNQILASSPLKAGEECGRTITVYSGSIDVLPRRQLSFYTPTGTPALAVPEWKRFCPQLRSRNTLLSILRKGALRTTSSSNRNQKT